MSDHPMMVCGHAANAVATRWKGKVCTPPLPCCAICDCIDQAASGPDLTGRLAKCCSRDPVPSNPNLAFFAYCPDSEYDRYYCGHAGWD